jgi:hypothetical protein
VQELHTHDIDHYACATTPGSKKAGNLDGAA